LCRKKTKTRLSWWRTVPELPEVETWRRLAEREGTGRTIREVRVAEDPIVMDENPPTAFLDALLNRKILETHRRGKHMWLAFDQPGHLYLHYGMSGSLWAHGPDGGPSHAKLALGLDNGVWLTYRNPRRIGKVRLYADARLSKPVSALGPDPLVDSLDAARLAEAFAGKKRPIKSTLLDQRLFAGVGNWIADEVLYQARLSPHRPCGGLKKGELTTLLRTLHRILEKAVDVGADDSRFPKTWLFHHRWGKLAEQTARGERIVFETIGGRTCAWVPERQV
jgi:formamidopyrimidine-DNA glycosylase